MVGDAYPHPPRGRSHDARTRGLINEEMPFNKSIALQRLTGRQLRKGLAGCNRLAGAKHGAALPAVAGGCWWLPLVGYGGLWLVMFFFFCGWLWLVVVR